MSNSYINLIDITLWDKARWRQTSFLVTPDLESQPGIGLQFEDLDSGIKIFQQWQQFFRGMADRENCLRIDIVSGEHPNRGRGFSIHLTRNPETLPPTPPGEVPFLFFTYAQHRFQSVATFQSLDWFRASFAQHGMFFVVPMPMTSIGDPSQYFTYMIGKNSVYFSDYNLLSADAIASEVCE